MGKSWEDFKKRFPWKAMTVGFLIPKGILFTGISLNMLFSGALLATLWCLAVFLAAHFREGKVNIFAVFALAMIFLRIAVILASKSPALYLFAQALDSALYASIFFISLLFPRSLIQLFAEASGVAMPDVICKSPYYGRAWRIITAVWGAVFMVVALILLMLEIHSLKSAAIVDMIASWPVMVILIAFTVIFPRWYWTKNIGEIPV